MGTGVLESLTLRRAEPGHVLRRMFRRGIEAVHVAGWCAADMASRRNLMAAYRALARRSWQPGTADARIRLGGSIVPIRFRQQDIYVIGEMLHDHPYRLRTTLPEHPVIFDAGANIGLSALWFAARYPGAHLFCFEPEAACFALLQENLRQLRTARLERVALGETTGAVDLRVTSHASDHSIFDTGSPAAPQRVALRRLDEYLQEHAIERVDLLKLDVEGSELRVLEGLGKLTDRVHTIIGECHERLVNPDTLYRFLEDHGYQLVAKRPVHAFKEDHMFEAARA